MSLRFFRLVARLLGVGLLLMGGGLWALRPAGPLDLSYLLVYTSDDRQTYRLEAYALEMPYHQVIADPAALNADSIFGDSFSPDEQTLLIAPMIDGDLQLGRYDIASKRYTPVAVPPEDSIELYRWLSDDEILVRYFGQTLFRVNVHTGERARLTDFNQEEQFAAASRDNAFIYLWLFDPRSNPDIFLVRFETATGQSQVIPTPPNAPITFRALSPDGQWLVYTQRDSVQDQDIYRMRLDGSEVQRLTHDDTYNSFGGFSPDGAWLYYTARVEESTPEFMLHRLRPDGSEHEIIGDYDGFGSFQRTFSPDGNWLYLSIGFGFQTELYRLQPEQGELQQVTDLPGRKNIIGLSPDNNWLIFSNDHDSRRHLYRMRPDGSDLAQITLDEHAINTAGNFTPTRRSNFSPLPVLWLGAILLLTPLGRGWSELFSTRKRSSHPL